MLLMQKGRDFMETNLHKVALLMIGFYCYSNQ